MWWVADESDLKQWYPSIRGEIAGRLIEELLTGKLNIAL